MSFWMWFWTVNFAVAGTAFAVIAVIVAIRGIADLRSMLAALAAERNRR